MVLLLAAVVLLLGSTPLAVAVPALSPLVAVASLLATGTMLATAWMGLAVAAIAIARRRWFCRWVCPMGTCADTVSRLGLRLGRRCPKMPPLGQWIALVTLGGAALGYPVLLWLDPLALFGGALGVAHSPASVPVRYGALGMALLLLASLAWPGLWCMRLCPLGALQDILASLTPSFRGGTSLSPTPSPPAPLPANGARGDALRLSRRVVLGVLAGLGVSTATRAARASGPHPLRPPGALDDERFVGVCMRCGNCLRACPADIIRLDSGTNGLPSLLTPVLDFSTDYCREDCTRCTDVCPSGALQRLTLKEKPSAHIGLAQVDMNVCLLGDDRDCAVCRTWCPYEAVQYVFCEDPDVYASVPTIDPEKCCGCGACEVMCPTKPVKAIVIVRQ